MRAIRRLAAIFREALTSALTQPVVTMVSLVMVAGMCATVILTTGRAAGAQQQVLGSIDSAGTRTIIVRAEDGAGLDSTVLQRIADVEGVSWAGAFGPAIDVSNDAVPSGPVVAMRQSWTSDLALLGIPETRVAGSVAYASAPALKRLGMQDGVGRVVEPGGVVLPTQQGLATPDYLRVLEPLVINPQPHERVGRVAVLVVIAERPELVAPLATVVGSVLGVDDPKKVKISTSEQFATLRGLVQGQLSVFGRSLVLIVFTLTAVLVAAILYSFVMIRRKDFGRRRALGASRSLIVGLLMAQMGVISAAGAVVGSTIGLVVLAVGGDPLPSWEFVLAIAVLSVAVGELAAALPAVLASRRDPLKELRVP